MSRFEARENDGSWAVYDTAQPSPAPMFRYPSQERAEKYADLLNAIDEDEPREIVERIRADLDALRMKAG